MKTISRDLSLGVDDLAIYVMTHGPECYYLREFTYLLEIGSATREKKNIILRDNTGDNISYKDCLYCELTGLYWIWKNDTHKYTGLYHYRRLFNLSSKKIHRYLKKYECIIPKPILIPYKSIRQSNTGQNLGDDWILYLAVLKDMYPAYYKSSETFYSQRAMTACNMFIASHEFLDRYCNWLFPMLFEIEKRKGIDDNKEWMKTRAIGYIGEHAFGLYVYHNCIHAKRVKILQTSISTRWPRFIHQISTKNMFILQLIQFVQSVCFVMFKIYKKVIGDRFTKK